MMLILIIDAEREMRDTILQAFQRDGYQSVIFYDGYEGTLIAKQIQPDFIINHIETLCANQCEVLRKVELNTKLAPIPVVLFKYECIEEAEVPEYSRRSRNWETNIPLHKELSSSLVKELYILQKGINQRSLGYETQLQHYS